MHTPWMRMQDAEPVSMMAASLAITSAHLSAPLPSMQAAAVAPSSTTIIDPGVRGLFSVEDAADTVFRRTALLQMEGQQQEKARADSDTKAWDHLQQSEIDERERLFWSKRKELMGKANEHVFSYLYRVASKRVMLVLAISLAFNITKPSRQRLMISCIAFFVALMSKIRARPVINKNPPAVRHFPIIGALPYVFGARKSVASFMLKRSRLIDFASFSISIPGPQSAVALMDTKDRVHVLRDNWLNYTKNLEGSPAGFDEVFYEMLGRGIFAVDGSEWRDHRKIAAHLFSAVTLRNQMQRVFHEHGTRLVDALLEKATNSTMVDIQDVMQSFTFDTICAIAFDEHPDALLESLNNKKPEFLVAFDDAQQILAVRGMEPPFWWRAKRLLNIGTERRARKQIAIVMNHLQAIIDRRKALDNDKIESRTDLLSMYLTYGRRHGLQYMTSDDYLKDVTLNIILAGRDTTSVTLTNWIRLVSCHPDVEEALLKEWDEKLPKDRMPDYEDIKECTYSSAVFNEVIRLYPPVPVDFRVANEDETLPSGLKVQKGERVGIPNLSIGRDPHLWHRADDFLPDRWLQIPGKVKRPEEYTFPVFWAGPRLCLGKDMARLEVITIAAMVFRKVRFHVKPIEEELFVNGPVCFLQGGVWGSVSKR